MVPAQIAALIDCALSVAPENRPSAAELVRELDVPEVRRPPSRTS
jgi:hypothetical protein